MAKPTPTKKPRDLAAVLEEIEGHATAAADAVSQARAQAALVVQSMASASRVIDDAVRQAKVSRDAIQSLTAEAVSLGGMADDDRAALQMLIARYGNE